MRALNFIFRLSIFVGVLSIFLAVSIIGRLFIRNIRARRAFHVNVVSFTCNVFLKVGRIRLQVKNPPPRDQHYLVVSNHLGFIDILIHAAVRPALFVTSVDMRETPGLGFLTEMGACLYVERRSRSNIHNEINEIREALRQGFNVVLFPEAASTSGEKVYPFKKTLLTSVVGTGVPILPSVLNFRFVDGEPMSHKYRDNVFWYGDISFLQALKSVLYLRTLDVEFEYLERIDIHTEEERGRAAQMAQAMIEAKYVPIVYPPGTGPSPLEKTAKTPPIGLGEKA